MTAPCSYRSNIGFSTLRLMSRDIAPFGLRLPADLKEQIAKSAKRNKRSLNSEMVGRLAASVDESHRPLRGYSDGELIKELMDRYSRGEIAIRIGWPDAPDHKA